MPENDVISVDIRDYTRVVWRRRWLIALTFAAAVGASLLMSERQTPIYSATAKVFIGPRSAQRGDLTSAVEELTYSREFVASYAELLRSRRLAEAVVKRLSLPASPTLLADSVETKVILDTRIIAVTATDDSPARAQLIANAVVYTFVQDASTRFGGRGVGVTVLEGALRPSSPVSPKPVRDGVLGGMLGLVLGVGVAFVLEHMDTTLRTQQDVESALAPLPVLATIPASSNGTGKRQIFIEQDPKAPAAEAFRILRTGVQFLGVERPLRSILVTSPNAEEGKTTVASNLAATVAAAGVRTILLETDLRRPRIHDYFDWPQSPGLTDVLVGRAELREALHPTRIPRLSVILSGQLPPNPAELLGSRRMEELMREIHRHADVVILDTPPALPVTDATVLGSHVDGVILVARAGRTHRERARQAVAAFERAGARVLGIVLNDVQAGDAYYYYYYHRYEQNGAQNGRAPTGEVPSEQKGWDAVHLPAEVAAAPRSFEPAVAPTPEPVGEHGGSKGILGDLLLRALRDQGGPHREPPRPNAASPGEDAGGRQEDENAF